MDAPDTPSALDALTPFLLIFGIFVVPIAAVVAFVVLRARARRARLRGPWTALAQRLGGQFFEGSGLTGSSVQAQRGTHFVRVKMTLASAMDAMSTPYYPDGGTFTEVIVDLHPHHPAHYVPSNARTQTFRDHTRVPILARVGAVAQIFVDPRSARIVLPGAVDDFAQLAASAQALEDLTQLVIAAGPMPAAA